MDYSYAQSQLSIVHEYLQKDRNPSADATVSALNVLFDLISRESDKDSTKLLIELIVLNEAGLVSFIKDIRKSPDVESGIISTCFNLLSIVVFELDCVCKNYVETVFDLCNTCIFWAKSLELRNHSFALMKKLAKHESSQSISDFSVKWKKLFNDILINSESVPSATEKKNIYELMGAIIDSFPHVLPNLKDRKKIIRKLNCDIACLITKDKGITELEGVLVCVNSFLLHFHENVDKNTMDSLYSSVKKVCEQARSRRTFAREALKLIGHRFDLFSENIFNDHSYWHLVIRDYLRSSNKDDYAVAYEVSDFFYRKMAELLLTKPAEISIPVLDFFTTELKKFLSSFEKREVTIALKNIGYFTDACKMHGKLAVVQELFVQMAETVEKFSLGFADENIEKQLLADMLMSLTNIVKNLINEPGGEEGLNVLIKLGRCVIMSYPKIPAPFLSHVKRAIIRTFIKIASINEYFFVSYLDQVVFVCLIQICSHLTQDDVTLLKELGASDKELLSFKNFVPLWCDLCNLRNVNYLQTIPESEKIELRRRRVDQRILDAFIESTLKILDKLDYSVVEDEISLEQFSDGTNNSEVRVNNESDYIILNNLVELFSLVIESCELEMFETWIPRLIKHFVEYAVSCPIKGGFFQLLTLVFRKSCSSFSFEEYSDISYLLRTFFAGIFVRVDEFEGPELITCLRMMMSAPLPIVKDIILLRINLLFEIIFVLGQEDLLLAQEGLKSLEKFQSIIPIEDFEVVLYSAIPHFGYFLESKNFVGETETITKYEENLLMPLLTKPKNSALRKYYNKHSSSTNLDLFTLQEQIVNYLGTVDAKYCISLYTPRIHTFSESYNYLKFEIPFADFKVNVFLDKFLPRTMEIASNSSDLKTRIIACEFLHSITTIFIANSNFSITYPKEMRQLFNNLIFFILKLGSDINRVVKQMFGPLCCQITRYYASLPMTENPATKMLLNILFNGVSNKTDSAFRFLCAKLIRVFVEWSLKQTKIAIRRVRVPINVENVIKKICFFCELPCSFKKMGAALAFIHVCSELKKEKNILNEFWIKLMLSFVKNLSLSSEKDCNNDTTRRALGYVGRVLRTNLHIFTKENNHWKIPQPFSPEKLDQIMIVLFKYCSSENKHCRHACMNLILDFGQIAGYKSLKSFCDSSADVKKLILNSFLECLHDEPDLTIDEMEQSLFKTEKQKKLHGYLQLSLSGLHCINWLLKEKVIAFHHLLDADSRFCSSLKFFCEKILPHNLSLNVPNCDCTIDNRSINSFEPNLTSLKLRVFLQYLEVLSFSDGQLSEFIGEELFQRNLWQHFIDYLFNQSEKTSSIHSSESTTRVLISFLGSFDLCKSPKMNLIYSQIKCSLDTRKFWKILEDFKDESELIICINDQLFIYGLIVLQIAGILSRIIQDIGSRQKRIISNVFRALNANNIAVSYTSKTTLFLESVLDFCLLNVDEELIFNFIFDESLLIDRHSNSEMSCGAHFFSTFKKIFAIFVSQHQQFFISRYLSFTNGLSKQRVRIILDCLSYQLNFNELICAIYEKWSVFASFEQIALPEVYVFEFVQQTINKYKNCENFCVEFQSNVFQWLLRYLMDADVPILTKERIIRLLPPFVIKDENTCDPQIFRCLIGVFQKQYLDPLGKCTLNENEFVLIFNALLKLLGESRNANVLTLVIVFRSFDSENVCDDEIRKSLHALMRQQSSDYQLEVLNVVYNFLRENNSDFSFDSHLSIVLLFLVPLLQLSRLETLIAFYKHELPCLLQILKSIERNYSTTDEEKNAITQQTCAVLLVETYCDCMRDLDCPEIVLSVYPNGESTLRKDLTRLIRSVVQKKVKIHDISNRSYFRLLKCYAYNALIKIIKKVQKDEKFYNLLFMESDRSGYIWKHLVDCQCDIKLSMAPEKISSKQKSLHQKKITRKNEKADTVRSLPSQYLSTSSLVEDIVKFDMSGWNKNDSSFESTLHFFDSISLEEEVLNKHECMAPLCELLKFLVESGISSSPSVDNESNPEMKPWMTCLHASLKYYLKEKNRNVVMFILRLIFNCEDIFCPYASSWTDLIIKCLLFLDEVNYFTCDLVTMLTFTWRNQSPPKTEFANDLVRLLLNKIDGNSTIRNYQLDLIGAVIDAWHSVLDSSLSLPQSHLKAENFIEINLRIAKRFLLYAILPFSCENMAKYLLNLVQLTKGNFKKKITELTFEVLALILRAVKCNDTVLSAVESRNLKEQLVDCLTWLRTNNATRMDIFFSSLDRVIVYYPEIVNRFSPYLLTNFGKLQGAFKIKCLKILANTASENFDDSLLLFVRQELANCLHSNDYELQKQALAILSLAAQKFEDQDVNKFLPILIRLSSHANPECRGLVYDVVDCIFSAFKSRIDDECEEIKLQCKTILLHGLLDNDGSLQQKMFEFWKSRSNLDEAIASRFLNIIREMYSPLNESHFVSYAVDFLLEASSSMSDFQSKIFDNPLMSDDKFQQYRILPSGSATRSILPEFSNSISHRVKTLSQSSEFPSLTFHLHSPQSDFMFQPTLFSDASFSKSDNRFQSQNAESVSESTARSFSEGSQFDKYKLRRRLQTNQSRATEHYASIHVRRKQRQHAFLKEKYEKTSKKITFYRTYRDGNFPDVQIPRSAVITPLRMLAKRDAAIAKLVLIQIFEEILSKISNKQDYLRNVNEIFNNILKLSWKHDRVFIETLLEIAFFHTENVSLNPDILVAASHSSGLYSLGTLLLENSLLNSDLTSMEHVSKKLKTDHCRSNDSWIQLAELYSALNEYDVVSGILQDKVSNNTCTVLKNGLTYEQELNFPAAMKIYKSEIENFSQRITQSYDKHFITEAFFKCAGYLSEWYEVNTIVRRQFNDLNDIWNDTWNVEHTLPWFLTSEAYQWIYNHRPTSNLLELINCWLENDNKNTVLTNLVAEQMAVLFIFDDQKSKATVLVKDCLKFIINNWHQHNVSLNHFVRLQIISEINMMLDALEVSTDLSIEEKINNVLEIWEKNIPGKFAISFWDKRTMNRILFSEKYVSELSADVDFRQKLENCKIISKLRVMESAINQRNGHIAKKYLCSLIENEFVAQGNSEPVIPDGFLHRFWLDYSKVMLLQAIYPENAERIDDFFSCLNSLEKSKVVMDSEYYAHLAAVMSEFLKNADIFCANQAVENEFISRLERILQISHLDRGNLLNEVFMHGVLANYEKSADFARNQNNSRFEISSVYLIMAKHCKKFIEDGSESNIYEEHFIRSLLRAMKFDSKEACILFPTLLHLSHISNDSMKEIFSSESEEVEEWKYLPWIQQLLAYVGTDRLSLVENILRKIVNRYPNAMQLTFQSSVKNLNCNNPRAQQLIDELRLKIDPDLKTTKFIDAVSHIRTPKLFFDHWWNILWKAVKGINILDELVDFERKLMEEIAYKGELFSDHSLLKSFRECINKVKNSVDDQDLININMKHLKQNICDDKKYDQSDRQEFLEYYSPDCAKFSWYNSDIEIPGQYEGFSMPMPERHIKIYSFHERVKVQHSKQKPIKIKIIGSDAKKYTYLVKFEDDMRQDQRIQQIYRLVNQCASSAENINSKNQNVITYGVFPLAIDFGIIEWVQNTTTLKDFMVYGLTRDEKLHWMEKRENLLGLYHRRLREQFVSDNSLSDLDVYEEAVKKFDKNFVISSFQRCSKEIPENVFRKSLLALCHSPSAFWNLRNQFMRSYSSMCIYGWILGIGDRHLKNTLVCLKTGNCVAIDFGYAFETGVECTRVPELIPFRMTPHLKSIMSPMYLTGLIRETMVTTLAKIRENEQVLLAALQIFILEPALNWLNIAKRRIDEQEEDMERRDLQWYPAQKVETIRKKLGGKNPTVILIDEIRKNQIINGQYKNACVKLITYEECLRNTLPEDNLKVSTQVDCLLDLATDECILGVSWCGLETYI